MTMYLNQNAEQFKKYLKNKIFVDKSLIVRECNEVFGSADSFLCFARPRGFGKSLALSMLNTYYSKGCDSRELFEGLAISKDPSFREHLNKHNVFCIDMASLYASLVEKNEFVSTLRRNILSDVKDAYPSLDFSDCFLDEAFAKINSAFGDRFIFLIDEWDVIYREQGNNKKLCDAYTMFLRSVFKSYYSSSCFDLVYMTGIFPVGRCSSQSGINMFSEYNVMRPRGLPCLFGFTEDEVKGLCKKYNADFSAIKNWYGGYRYRDVELYNPLSVVTALDGGRCGDYWAGASATEAITSYMNFDNGVLKGDIAELLSGGEVRVDPGMFGNALTMADSQDATLCVLIHLGYLAYDPVTKSCRIPNKEIAEELVNALEALDWKEIYDPISHSERLLSNTLSGNIEEINTTLDRNHKGLATLFSKDKEHVLGTVVCLSYFSAREHYEVRKEEASTLGRADLSFVPFEAGRLPFIVELKVGKSPDEAIAQIKERHYWKAWKRYRGKVLLVGIAYDSNTLKHTSKIEWIEVE